MLLINRKKTLEGSAIQYHRQASSAEQCILNAVPCQTQSKSPWRLAMGSLRNKRNLAVAGHGPQLAGQEVIRRPGAADGHFAVLELLGCRAIAVLILFHALG